MAISNLALQTASSTGQPVGLEDLGKTFRIFFTFKLSGAYAAHGDVFDLTQLFALTAGGPGASLPMGSLPLKVELQSIRAQGAANDANLFVYQFAPGTTLANGTVQVFTGAAAQTALTELSAGNYPAGVTTDTISGEAVFPKL